MNSIRWKLVLTTMIVVILPILYLNDWAVEFFDTFTRDEREKQLLETGLVVRGIYGALLEENGDAVERLRELLEPSRAYQDTRIRVLDPQGRLLLDTDPEDYTFDLAYPDRPEIQEAVAGGGYSARPRQTPDRKFMYFHYALPVKDAGNQVLGVVYVSRHTNSIIQAIRQMFAKQNSSTFWAVLFAAVAAVLFAWSLTRRLRRLTRAADAYARGALDTRVDAGGRDEIGALARAFNDMADELEQQQNYNREFLSQTMHELKAPVTAIKGAVEVLQEGAADKPEARDKFLGNIRFEADRLARLVNELNALTRLDVETLRGQREQVDYVQTLRGIIDRLMPGDRLALNLPGEELPVSIIPDRFEQVVANLIENAFRYAPEGRVLLKVWKDGNRVHTEVRDSGSGISAGNLPRIFDRFFTTEKKGEWKDHGSGLGLAICKSIIENHGGEISAASTEGEGTVIRFWLPVAG